MIETLQLPVLVSALAVMSWAVVRLNSPAKPEPNGLKIPQEVLRWQADLKNLSRELRAELDEKLEAVSALSRAYEEASQRLSELIEQARRVEADLGAQQQPRMSA